MGRNRPVLALAALLAAACSGPRPASFVGRFPVELTAFDRYRAIHQRKIQWDAEGYITEIDLFHQKLDESALSEIERQPRLRVLLLGDTTITDADLARLAGLTELTTLGLRRTAITDAGLKWIADLPALESLVLAETAVTDAGLVLLTAADGLQGLGLTGTAVTDDGLRHLEALPNLSEVHLAGTRVTQAGVERLRRNRPGLLVTLE
jgi:hypothetical protein